MNKKTVAENSKELFNITELKVSFKNKVEASKRVQIKSSHDAANILRNYFADEIEFRERFFVLYMNQSNHVIGIYEIGVGGITGTVADVGIGLMIAVNLLAKSMILCHNHPSGNLTPSKADKDLTQKYKNAALYFDMQVLDHVIITQDSFTSFADEGLL